MSVYVSYSHISFYLQTQNELWLALGLKQPNLLQLMSVVCSYLSKMKITTKKKEQIELWI